MPPYPGFFGPAYRSASYMADRERLINWYLEPNESPGAPTPYVMLPTPGFDALVEVPQAPIRGMFSLKDTSGERAFFVAGYELYELTYDGTDWTATARDAVHADTNPATFAWNGPNGGQMLITSGDMAYGYDLATDTLSSVLGSGATMCAFLSSRFLVLDAATATLQASDQLSTTFDPTMIAQRSLGADPWVSMAVANSVIYLWGNRTGEVWSDTGAFPFPFEPIPGAFFEQGIAAPFAVTRNGSPVVWLGQNDQGSAVIWKADGYSPQRVSTHGIEAQLASYSDVSDAFGFTYQDQGHLFSILTFPSGGQTFALDIPQGVNGWGERAFWDVATSTWKPLRVGSHCYAFGQHLVGDTMTGTIYRMAADVYTDVDGAGMRRLRQPPRLAFEQKRVNYKCLQLVMDVGIGLPSGQGSDPQVMLKTSGDGGRTWGNEHWQSAGAIGAYNTRVFWAPLGQQRNRVDQITVTDPVPYRITDATIEYTVGRS